MNSLNGGMIFVDCHGFNINSSVGVNVSDIFQNVKAAIEHGKTIFLVNCNLDGDAISAVKVFVASYDENTITFSNGVFITKDGIKGIQPYVVTEPSDATGEIGTLVTFSCSAVGIDLTYQWQYQVPNGTQWLTSTQAGATTNTLADVEIRASRDGQKYRCRITDKYGTVIYTRSAVMTVSV